MFKYKRKLAFLSLVVGSLFMLASCQSDYEVRLLLDWVPNSNHAGIYVAETEGYFADADLDVSITPPVDPTAIIAAVAAGNADFGLSYNIDVLQARAAGVDVVSVLALVQHPLVSIVALADSGISQPSDLAGRRIGYPGIASQAGMLDTLLASADLTRDDVELANVGFDLVRQLLSGNVDAVLGAYFTHEAHKIEQEDGAPPNVIRVEQHGVPDYYELLLITNPQTLNERPEVVGRFVAALRKGFEYAEANRQSAIDSIVSVAGEEALEEQLEREIIEMLAPFWTDSGAVRFGTQLESRWIEVADWLEANDLVEGSLDATAAFTNRFSESR